MNECVVAQIFLTVSGTHWKPPLPNRDFLLVFSAAGWRGYQLSPAVHVNSNWHITLTAYMPTPTWMLVTSYMQLQCELAVG